MNSSLSMKILPSLAWEYAFQQCFQLALAWHPGEISSVGLIFTLISYFGGFPDYIRSAISNLKLLMEEPMTLYVRGGFFFTVQTDQTVSLGVWYTRVLALLGHGRGVLVSRSALPPGVRASWAPLMWVLRPQAAGYRYWKPSPLPHSLGVICIHTWRPHGIAFFPWVQQCSFKNVGCIYLEFPCFCWENVIYCPETEIYPECPEHPQTHAAGWPGDSRSWSDDLYLCMCRCGRLRPGPFSPLQKRCATIVTQITHFCVQIWVPFLSFPM